MIQKNINKIFLIIIWMGFIVNPTNAQSRLSVDINDPVYTLIEIGEVKGILTKISQVKPYTHQDVYTFLSKMKAREYELSTKERKILDEYLVRFSPTFSPDSSISDFGWNGGFDYGNQEGHARMGFRTGMHLQFAAEDPSRQYASIPIELYVQGDFLNSLFSYYINVILNTGSNSSYPFANFGERKAMGLGFWQRWFGSPKESEIWETENLHPWAQALETTPELAGQFWDDRILLRMGILRNREINSGLMLSKHAAPFSAFELAVRPTNWFNFYYLTGALNGGRNTLGSDIRDTEFHNDILVQNIKMFSYHTGEFFISDYFYMNIWESVVWGSRMEVSYLIPVNIFLMAQNLIGDHDNMAFGAGASTIIPHIGKLETNVMIDEFQGKNLGKNPRNMIAWDLGMRFHIPWVSFSQFSFKYTYIGPYLYTHYPQNYAQMGQNREGDQVLIDTGFNHRGKSLGSFLKPNSDQFNFEFNSLLMPGLNISVGYSLVRHGNSAPHKYWLGKDGNYYTTQEREERIAEGDESFFFEDSVWAWDRDNISGELNSFLNYRVWDANPWDKRFLKDAIYDWTNSISLNASYDLRFLKFFNKKGIRREIPVIIGFGYTFAHTFYDFNGKGFSHIDPEEMNDALAWAERFGYTYKNNFKNIFSFRLTVYPRQ